MARLYSKKVADFMPVHKLAQHTRTTINDYPVPKGSWHVNYAARQSRMNRQLALSAALFVCTLVGVRMLLSFIVLIYFSHPSASTLIGVCRLESLHANGFCLVPSQLPSGFLPYPLPPGITISAGSASISLSVYRHL